MKKKLAALITPMEQHKLYVYGLLDSLSTISGIGKQTLQDLQDEFDAKYSSQQVPSEISWVYRLTLDVIKQPLNAEQLCAPRDGQPSILDSFVRLDTPELRTINTILGATLSPTEKTVVVQLYRDRIAPEYVARQIGHPKKNVYSIKSRAFKKLRQPQYLKALTGIVFVSNSFN